MSENLIRSATACQAAPRIAPAGHRVSETRRRGRRVAPASPAGNLLRTLGAVLTRHSAHYGRPHLS